MDVIRCLTSRSGGHSPPGELERSVVIVIVVVVVVVIVVIVVVAISTIVTRACLTGTFLNGAFHMLAADRACCCATKPLLPGRKLGPELWKYSNRRTLRQSLCNQCVQSVSLSTGSVG